MNIYEILGIIVIHYIADFITQTDYQANNKSKSFRALISHTYDYFLIWLIFGVLLSVYDSESYFIDSVIIFSILTFVLHTATDYVTSKITSYYYKKQKFRKFFWVVGFDQILHYVQLFICYKILFK